MTVALVLSGWFCALLAGWRVLVLGRRLELVASAEHELRGPLAALTLATARSRPLPPTLVEGQLERAHVALADLTDDQREVVELRFFAGLSVYEVAAVMGRQEGTVRGLQFRAIAALRRSLAIESAGSMPASAHAGRVEVRA